MLSFITTNCGNLQLTTTLLGGNNSGSRRQHRMPEEHDDIRTRIYIIYSNYDLYFYLSGDGRCRMTERETIIEPALRASSLIC